MEESCESETCEQGPDRWHGEVAGVKPEGEKVSLELAKGRESEALLGDPRAQKMKSESRDCMRPKREKSRTI